MDIHILGICGTFMGGLALLARAAGHRVTGCDANVYPPMSAQLEAAGIALIEGFSADQIALKPDLFVVGNAISRGNPLLEGILDLRLRYVSGPQWLAEHVLHHKWVLAVAGTHGKTTTTSMLAWILESAGLRPGFLVGGVPSNFGESARWSESEFFVIEADEYDTAFCDKRSKFVHYRPRTAILNNLEFDHADIFSDLAAIETQFHHLVRLMPGSGLIVANAAEESLRRVLQRGIWTPVEWFNSPQTWWCTEPDEGGQFEVRLGEQSFGATRLVLPGKHNRLNAVAAVAAARHAGVPSDLAVDALNAFQGVKRRMELRGIAGGVTVYDDFAHHPTAIAASLVALRKSASQGSIHAVLEPRSNTMRLGVMKAQLPSSLAAADRVYCFGANLGWDATSALSPIAEKTMVSQDLESIVAAVAARARPGDHVLVMSNGGFGGIHEKLLAALASRPEPSAAGNCAT